MKHLFWLIPGEIAGRAGPDEEAWKVEELWRGGVRAILSVNDGRLCDPLAFARWGIAYACCPLSDWVPPQRGDAEVCLRALWEGDSFVQAQRRQGRPVLVHCSGSNDRTGLFLSYYLVRHAQLSPTQAIQRVRALRPTALSADGWEEFAEELLRIVADDRQ
jgi:protein-tyrosine phosphatase